MKYFPMVTGDHWYINSYGTDLRQLDKDLPKHIRSYDEKAFLKDPRNENVITLQYMLWSVKIKQYMDALAHVLNTGQGVVLDRCVYSESVFTNTLYEMGFIKRHERAALQKMKDKVMHNLMKPHLIVYLDAPVSVVETNLKNRGLGEEKVWNREMLEKLEYVYKHEYLKNITQHAELVAYDWSTPGDAEVIVEDIERIDFDRFDIHDPKMEDWRLKEDWDWSEKRWDFTTRSIKIIYQIWNTPTLDCPQLDMSGEENILYDGLREKIPGEMYTRDFNPGLDKNLLFMKSRIWVDKWPDYDPKVKAQGK